MSKLGFKIFIIFLVVSIGGLLLTSIFINFRFNYYFENYLRDIRKEKVINLKFLLEESYTQNDNWSEAQDIIGSFASLNDFRVILRNNTGEVIAFSTPNMFGRMNQNMMGRMSGQLSNLLPINAENYDTISIYEKNNEIGELLWQKSRVEEIFSNTEDIFMRQINRAILIVALITGLFVIIITYFFSNYLTVSLNKMNKFVKKVEEGNLDQSIDIKGNDEVAQLGKSFNQMVKKLKYLEEIRRESASDLAHELRTPLSNIKNYIEAIEDDVIEINDRTIKEIDEELDRLINLIDRLNDLNEADAKILNIEKTYFDITETIKKVTKSFEITAKTKSINFKYEFDDETQIYADKKAIQQILYNLISNAVKYAYEKTKILLEYKNQNDYYIIKISNKGPVINKEDITLLFDRFYRVDKSRNTETGGLGIGLTITRNLVEAHGGQIKVESKVDLTTFIIYFPKE